MERREMLVLLASAATAAPAAVDIASYKPRFFTSAEYKTIDLLTELLIPNDGTPGAHDTGVRYYIDTVLHFGDEAAKRTWRTGLVEIDAKAKAAFGKPFAACSPAEQRKFMAAWFDDEEAPVTPLDRFIRPFKLLTVEAYAHAEAAQREYFGYRGNRALHTFPGCQESHE